MAIVMYLATEMVSKEVDITAITEAMEAQIVATAMDHLTNISIALSKYYTCALKSRIAG